MSLLLIARDTVTVNKQMMGENRGGFCVMLDM